MLASRPRSSETRSHSRVRHVSAPRRWIGTDSDEDQSSWIADDICTHCGGLAPHGKLYCSRKCRDADASDKQLPEDQLSQDEADSDGIAETLKRLRYPMTLSPSVQGNVGLPKLTKSRSAKTTFMLARQNSSSSISSEDDLETGLERPAHTRHGSRSSVSTGSDLVDTDLTTPSPWQSGIDLDDDNEFSKLDDAELQLPPAMCPSSQVLLRKGTSSQSSTSLKSSSFTAPRRTFMSPTLAPQSNTVRGSGFHMQFSRLPGSTNLPTPVFYSAGPTQTPGKMGHAVTKSRSSDSAQDVFADLTNEAAGPSVDLHSASLSDPVQNQMSKTERTKSFSAIQGRLNRPSNQSPLGVWKQNVIKTKAATNHSPRRTYSDTSELCDCQKKSLRANADTGSTASMSGSAGGASSDSRTACESSDHMETPVRGRALRRTGHSCGSGHRRSSRASCDPCTLLRQDSANSTTNSTVVPVPTKNRVAVLDF